MNRFGVKALDHATLAERDLAAGMTWETSKIHSALAAAYGSLAVAEELEKFEAVAVEDSE